MRWLLQPLQPLQKTQLQPPFGPSVDSLCHLWFTTTNFSYRFLFLKLPPPPCAVLLVFPVEPLPERIELLPKQPRTSNLLGYIPCEWSVKCGTMRGAPTCVSCLCQVQHISAGLDFLGFVENKKLVWTTQFFQKLWRFEAHWDGSKMFKGSDWLWLAHSGSRCGTVWGSWLWWLGTQGSNQTVVFFPLSHYDWGIVDSVLCSESTSS